MSRCRVLSVLGVSAALAALTVAFIPLPQAKPAAARADAAAPAADGLAFSAESSGNYQIDSAHSSMNFRVMHMNLAWFYGRFNELTGTFVLDVADPAKSSVEFIIPVASVDTANEKRDQHLRHTDFFSATEFPEISFKSDAVKSAGEGRLEVSGTLSMHGESKPLTVVVELTGAAPAGGRRPAMVGLHTTFMLKRSDFRIGTEQTSLGDEVHVVLSVEARKAD